MNNILPGFKRASGTNKHRLIVAVDGVEKHGKTHFSLTAPGPIAVINLDVGHEGVVGKFCDNKHIEVSDYLVDPRAEEVDYGALWERLKNDYYTALEDKTFRTIVFDTATEVWDLLRLARFGKLTQIMPHKYTEVNTEYREMMRTAYSNDKNLVLLHKVKDEWVNDASTGRKIRAGFKDTGYLVQANVLAYRDAANNNQFTIRVNDCRQNAFLKDFELAGEAATFPNLAATIFGDDIANWE